MHLFYAGPQKTAFEEPRKAALLSPLFARYMARDLSRPFSLPLCGCWQREVQSVAFCRSEEENTSQRLRDAQRSMTRRQTTPRAVQSAASFFTLRLLHGKR